MGWFIFFGVVIFIGFLCWGGWALYNGVSITNSERRKNRADAEIAERERNEGSRLRQKIDFNTESNTQHFNKETPGKQTSKAKELKDIAELLKDELITIEEYEKLKEEILNR